MPIISILAIFFLFWFFSLFLVLPFGVRTGAEMGHVPVPGQADSAPGNFRIARTVLRVTILATIFTGLFYMNYRQGWITRASFDPLLEALGAPR